VAKALKNIANALAIGIGAGMEGYGKGTIAALQQQREEALAEVRERRADQRSMEDRQWRTEESEKDRDFRREASQESMAWDREKFGMQEESADRRAARSEAAAIKLAQMRGGAERQDPAAIQELKYYADIARKKRGGDEITHEDELWAIEQVRGPRGGGERDDRTATMKEAQELARLAAKAESGDESAQRELQAYHQRLGLGEFAKQAKGGLDIASPEYAIQHSKLVQGEIAARDPMGVKNAQEMIPEIIADLESRGIPRPGSAGASPSAAAAPEAQTRTASPNAPSPRQHLAGAGTENDPYVANTEEELERLYNRLPPGTFVRYGNQLLEK
jgi:hypothetical protein